MFFVTCSDERKKKISQQKLKELEKYLIRKAKDKNPELINRANTKIGDWSIDGVYRSRRGVGSKGGRVLKKMMGL